MFPDQLTKDGLPTKNVAKAAQQVRLTAYNGTNIPCYGITDAPCKFKDSGWENTKFYIVDVPGPAIIGLPSYKSLKVVTMHRSINPTQPADKTQASRPRPINTVNNLADKYPGYFDRIGKFPGKVKLVTDPDAPPYVNAPRKTPIAQKECNQR